MGTENKANVRATIRYLADIPLYLEQKPFLAVTDVPNEDEKKEACANIVEVEEDASEDSDSGDDNFVESQPINTDLRYDSGGDGIASSRHNLVTIYHPDILITDVRGSENDLSLDTHGFEIRHRPIGREDPLFVDAKHVSASYLSTMETFVKNELKAAQVLMFDHGLRTSDPKHRTGKTPSQMAHIDLTFDASIRRVKFHAKENAEILLKGRFQVVNVWHPLVGPVEDWPLALCEYSSVDPEADLVAADFIRPHYIGEQWYTKYNPNHKWYYLSDQQPHECWFFKMFDSAQEGEARFTVHCAFDLAKHIANPSPCPRNSIELRFLVFYSG